MGRKWTIRPLCFGEFPAYDKSRLLYLQDQREEIPLPVLGWLLESGSDTVLVDTGPSPPNVANLWHTFMAQTTGQSPETAVRNVGVDPARLKLVILTHLHWDHCHNLDMFPAAKLVVQREELRSAIDPIATQRLPYESGISGLTPPWFRAFDRFQVVRGDVEILPGLVLITLPGHTPGLQGVVIDTEIGRHVIASDALPLFENLGTDQTGPIPNGIHYDVADCLHSIERIQQVADVILPGHDSTVLRHSQYPFAS